MGKLAMNRLNILTRALAIAGIIIVFGLCAGLSNSLAQAQPGASDQPQKVHDLLNLLGNPEVQKWIAAQKDAAPVAAKPGVGDEASDLSWMALTERVRQHISNLIMAIPALPGEIENATSAIGSELMGRGPLWMILLFALFLGGGFVVQWLFWRSTRFWREWIAAARLDTQCAKG
jgi:moderate conductance mechanosensitive channel